MARRRTPRGLGQLVELEEERAKLGEPLRAELLRPGRLDFGDRLAGDADRGGGAGGGGEPPGGAGVGGAVRGGGSAWSAGRRDPVGAGDSRGARARRAGS